MGLGQPRMTRAWASRRRRRVVRSNLMLVPVGRSYRPALPIAEVAELADAFARGQADRASHEDCDAAACTGWPTDASRDVRDAYFLGFAGAERVRAPAPILVAASIVVADRVVRVVYRARPSRGHRVIVVAALLAAAFPAARRLQRTQVRRARALGVTPQTAPRPAPITTVGAAALRLLIVLLQQLWIRHRTGRWWRASDNSVVAAAAIREVVSRRDWRDAHRATRNLA